MSDPKKKVYPAVPSLIFATVMLWFAEAAPAGATGANSGCSQSTAATCMLWRDICKMAWHAPPQVSVCVLLFW